MLDPMMPDYRRSALAEADRYARAVAGESFDVIELPDYRAFGALLASALRRHGVRWRAVVIAMHGNISRSISLGWQSSGDNTLDLEGLEFEQFSLADAAYGLSPRYIDEWRERYPRTVHYIDPLAILESPEIPPLAPTRDKPALYCIGRMERRKGNDLFIELVRWIDRSAFAEAVCVGEENYAPDGTISDYILQQYAERREISIRVERSYGKDQLRSLFADRTLVVLPVRYDTLNLVAIEALLSGCPIAVSDGAGVCDWLDRHFPGIPYVRIDTKNYYAAAAEIENLLRDYDVHREVLLTYLRQRPTAASRIDIEAIYADALGAAARRCNRSIGLVEYSDRGSVSGAVHQLSLRILPPKSRQTLKRIVRNPRAELIRVIQAMNLFNDARFARNAGEALRVGRRLASIARYPEHNVDALREKLHALYGSCVGPMYRGNFWREIARIERLRGNDLVAATYEIRLLRLLGDDRFGLLEGVVGTLRAHGFSGEAEACECMYGDAASPERVLAYLEDQRVRHLRKSFSDLKHVLDHRKGNARVSVIVSLYRAAPKLRFFLTALAQQTLIRHSPESVEIILVDSASPSDELAALSEYQRDNPLNVVYLRSHERETIQNAWNRGISIARGEYLVFLGVDETLYPEALRVLSDELDQNPNIDWVMGNSLVTSVDANGLHLCDVMTYDRAGGTKDHTYLETCYVSWVGGMYRKRIHERFGWYDETFAAAGDTEFKNRVFPFIEVRFIPKLLGLFLNYPDERTTESPRAELEDSRAWYIHRTFGGVRYGFSNRRREDAARLMWQALGYRKSFCRHVSTDIEYALNLARFLADDPLYGSGCQTIEPGLTAMLSDLRSMEYTARQLGRLRPLWTLLRTRRHSATLEKVHARELSSQASPQYAIHNDNRFEQHSWLWKTS